MDFRVLGQLEVLADGQSLDLGPLKQRSLLALLLIHANEIVSTDRILDELWGEEAEGKETALWVYVSRLRSVLEPERTERGESSILLRRDRGYVLAVEPRQVDALRFEERVAEGRSQLGTDPEAASRILTEALEMWRGSPLEDFTYDSFAETEISRLQELRLEALESRVDADLATGKTDLLVSDLEGLVRDNPLRERLTGQLMLALYRSGRQAEALRVYQHARRTLGEELGIEPGRELRDLEQSILEQDSSLDLAPPSEEPKAERKRRRAVYVFPALAVVTGIAVLAFLLARDEGGPTIGGRHPVPPGSTAAASAGGLIWVLLPDMSEIASVDPQTGETIKYLLPHRPSAMAAGLGSLWVASEERGHLARISPLSGQVTAEIDGLNLDGASLSVGHDAVWIVREDVRPFIGVDPDDLSVMLTGFASEFVPRLPSVAAATDLLWGTNADIGVSMWLEPESGEFGFVGDPRLGEHSSRSVAVDRGAVWISQPTNGSITRVDVDSKATTAIIEVGMTSGIGLPLLREPYYLASGPGGLWAALPEDGMVVRLDEATGEITASISFDEPVAIVAVSGALWVLDAQLAEIVRVDPETCDEIPFIGPGADLRGCDLTDSLLLGADLTGADLRWATVDPVMQSANFTSADLRGVDLQDAILEGVTWNSTRCPDGSLSDDSGGTCLGSLRP